MQRLPWAPGLIFGDAVGVLRRRSEGGHVAHAGDGAADVDQRKAYGAPDGRIALRARPEDVVSRIDAQFFSHRTIDNDQGGGWVSRGLDAVEVERLFAHGFDGEHDERKIFRTAARHHRVGSEPQWCRRAIARRDRANWFVPRTVAIGQHPFHAFGRRRHDGQTVAPAALTVQVVDRVEIVVRLDGGALALEQLQRTGQGACSFRRAMSWGMATLARLLTSSSEIPPRG